VIERYGWKLLFHACLIEQLQKVHAAAQRVRTQDPQRIETNSNVKLFNALSQLIFETVPSDPGRDEYRQGNTMGTAFRHWRRAEIGRRFRLFFRFDSKARIIIFAWVNDEHTLRSSGSKTDPYAVFQRMLERGRPPDNWSDLLEASAEQWVATSLTQNDAQ
jgi:toxin YhaV